jgi:hypothetical protein
VPLTPGRISPRAMDDRQWATFVAQAGIQADNTVKTFTPTWTGFSVDPSGDLSYQDFGSIVMVWWEDATALLGNSNANFMTITNLPENIRPRVHRKGMILVCDNGSGIYEGFYSINSGGTITFGLADTGTVANRVTYTTTGFTAASTKGLAGGVLFVYAK